MSEIISCEYLKYDFVDIIMLVDIHLSIYLSFYF